MSNNNTVFEPGTRPGMRIRGEFGGTVQMHHATFTHNIASETKVITAHAENY